MRYRNTQSTCNRLRVVALARQQTAKKRKHCFCARLAVSPAPLTISHFDLRSPCTQVGKAAKALLAHLKKADNVTVTPEERLIYIQVALTKTPEPQRYPQRM